MDNKHIMDIKQHYEERGCTIEVCPICKKFTKFDFNNKAISGHLSQAICFANVQENSQIQMLKVWL